jgi:hypothetical protein
MRLPPGERWLITPRPRILLCSLRLGLLQENLVLSIAAPIRFTIVGINLPSVAVRRTTMSRFNAVTAARPGYGVLAPS